MRRAIAALALLLFVVPVHAEDLGDWTADEGYFQAGSQEGALDLFWTQYALTSDIGQVDLDIQAASVSGIEYQRDSAVLPASWNLGTEVYVPMGLEFQERAIETGPAVIRFEAIEAVFALAVFSDGPMDASLRTGGFQTYALPTSKMDLNGIAAPEATSRPDSPAGGFSTVMVDEPRLVSSATRTGFNLTLHGDLVLELRDAALNLTEAGGTHQVVEGRRIYSSMVEGGDEVVVRSSDHFVRLSLHDATLSLSSPFYSGLLEWAMPWTVLRPEGLSTFSNVAGTLRGPQGSQSYDGNDLQIRGPGTLSIVPQESRLKVHLDGPAGAYAPDGTFVAAPASLPLWIVSLAAAGAFLAVLLVLRVRRRAPTLEDVEAALEAGRHVHAARLAGRILRHRPDEEGAWVARAVSLSRAGRHSEVIREVESHLRAHEPSDGVLHYVLGLAYLERGQAGEGLIRLEEAVRRTPELDADVAPLRPNTGRPAAGYT